VEVTLMVHLYLFGTMLATFCVWKENEVESILQRVCSHRFYTFSFSFSSIPQLLLLAR